MNVLAREQFLTCGNQLDPQVGVRQRERGSDNADVWKTAGVWMEEESGCPHDRSPLWV